VTQLELREPAELVGSFDRPNLVYRVLPRATMKRQIRDVLARHAGQADVERHCDAEALLVGAGAEAHMGGDG